MVLEGSELQETSDVSACVSFTTRRFAERAFLQGKSWQGHKLQFTWLSSTNNTGKDVGTSGSHPVASNVPSDAQRSLSIDDASTDNPKPASEPENRRNVEDVANSDEQKKNSKSTSTSSSSSSEGELLVVQ